MKFLYSYNNKNTHRFLYNETPDKNTHEKIAGGVELVAQAPLNVVDWVSDGVHNTLKKIPILKIAPILTHPIAKGAVNATNGLVGGTAKTLSKVATHTVGGVGNTLAQTGKGAVSYAPYSKAQRAEEKAEELAEAA